MEAEMTEGELREALREALDIPGPIWEHSDPDVFTIEDLKKIFDLGDSAARTRAKEAVEAGRMQQGFIKGSRGHYVKAYRPTDDD